MPSGNTVLKELEPTDAVPEYLKKALVSEVNSIRDTMTVVTHFTEHFLNAFAVTLSSVERD